MVCPRMVTGTQKELCYQCGYLRWPDELMKVTGAEGLVWGTCVIAGQKKLGIEVDTVDLATLEFFRTTPRSAANPMTTPRCHRCDSYDGMWDARRWRPIKVATQEGGTELICDSCEDELAEPNIRLLGIGY